MNKQWMIGAALAAIVLVGITFSGQQGVVDAQATSVPTAVAVVDINAVITGSKRNAALQADQATRDQTRKTEGQAKQTQLEKLKSDLDLLAPGSSAHNAKTRELLELAATAQAWNTVGQQMENSQRSREFLALYEAASAAVAQVAQDRGIDIVIVTSELPDMAQLARAESQQIAAILQNRKVLYSKDSADITQAVLARMNADF